MKTTTKFAFSVLAVGAATLAAVSAAEAKRAHCFTTDDGYYDCNFKGTDANGGFMIWASGYPTFTLEMDRPGVAYGYADYGSGNVSLPGTYFRNRSDRACWDNSDTSTQICAW